ncbi:hypothetical protein I5U54_14260 [Stenotrophomonas maltophilia]|nr:hypothetical protein [Stenotrophomonas maltophilia]
MKHDAFVPNCVPDFIPDLGEQIQDSVDRPLGVLAQHRLYPESDGRQLCGRIGMRLIAHLHHSVFFALIEIRFTLPLCPFDPPHFSSPYPRLTHVTNAVGDAVDETERFFSQSLAAGSPQLLSPR